MCFQFWWCFYLEEIDVIISMWKLLHLGLLSLQLWDLLFQTFQMSLNPVQLCGHLTLDQRNHLRVASPYEAEQFGEDPVTFFLCGLSQVLLVETVYFFIFFCSCSHSYFGWSVGFLLFMIHLDFGKSTNVYAYLFGIGESDQKIISGTHLPWVYLMPFGFPSALSLDL